ncbi:MAG TPA: DUF1801 domain-containing protein [Azospirillaceae bacterium]|nr:DUF1801 domain-containing protein [Azospirillaceae bacterium]
MVTRKTEPEPVDVAAFLDAVEPAQRREDARTVCALMERLSGQPPVLWSGGMIGFGRYAYRYESGHAGEWFRTGFGPRKAALTLYVMGGFDAHEALLARLGKHSTGKSCLYVKRLQDIDPAVLEELVAASLAHMRARYPEGA